MEDFTKICKDLKKEELIQKFKPFMNSDGTYTIVIRYADKKIRYQKYDDIEALKAGIRELEEKKEKQVIYAHENGDTQEKSREYIGSMGIVAVGTITTAAAKDFGAALIGVGALIISGGTALAKRTLNYDKIQRDLNKHMYFINNKDRINEVIRTNPLALVDQRRDKKISKKTLEIIRECINDNRDLSINDIDDISYKELEIINGYYISKQRRK